MFKPKPIGSRSSTPRIKLKGLKTYVSKGVVYAYHRATGTRLTSPFGSQEFFAEVAKLNAVETGGTIKPGSWGALVALYKASPKFTQELKPRTRKDYDDVLKWLSPIGDMPISEITRGFFMELRDKAYKTRGRSFANYVQSVMSAAFTWGWERQKVDHHPIRGIKKIARPKGQTKVNRPWTKDEWDLVTSKLPPHLLAPVMLCGVLGWREGEAVHRPVGDYDPTHKKIKRISSKNGKEVKTPVPAKVAAALAALLPHDKPTLLVNSRGKSWTEAGFRASFFKFIATLDVEPGLTVHGLRHTCATRMKELGVSRDVRKEMLGQDTDEMAEHYSRDADMQKQLADVVTKMDEIGS